MKFKQYLNEQEYKKVLSALSDAGIDGEVSGDQVMVSPENVEKATEILKELKCKLTVKAIETEEKEPEEPKDDDMNEGEFDKIPSNDLEVMRSIIDQYLRGKQNSLTPSETQKLYDLLTKYKIDFDVDKKTIDPKFMKKIKDMSK